MEVLGVDESGGYVDDIGDDEDCERVGVKEVEPTRQILLAERKGNFAGQNR